MITKTNGYWIFTLGFSFAGCHIIPLAAHATDCFSTIFFLFHCWLDEGQMSISSIPIQVFLLRMVVNTSIPGRIITPVASSTNLTKVVTRLFKQRSSSCVHCLFIIVLSPCYALFSLPWL